MVSKMMSLLFPVDPGSLEDMLEMQGDTYAKRRRDRTAICNNQYGSISLFYGLQMVLSTVAALLVIVLGFVIWPVHDVVHEPSYWWECALQCSVFWTCEFDILP